MKVADLFTPIGTRMCPYPPLECAGVWPQDRILAEMSLGGHRHIRNILKRLRRRDRTETAAQRDRRLGRRA